MNEKKTMFAALFTPSCHAAMINYFVQNLCFAIHATVCCNELMNNAQFLELIFI